MSGPLTVQNQSRPMVQSSMTNYYVDMVEIFINSEYSKKGMICFDFKLGGYSICLEALMQEIENFFLFIIARKIEVLEKRIQREIIILMLT